jgi:hypothetical protein
MALNSRVVYMPFAGTWVESLNIPIVDSPRMSSKPLHWLRFLCYAFRIMEGKSITIPTILSTSLISSLVRHFRSHRLHANT